MDTTPAVVIRSNGVEVVREPQGAVGAGGDPGRSLMPSGRVVGDHSASGDASNRVVAGLVNHRAPSGPAVMP